VLPITATIDHRFVDGSQISTAMAAFREYLAAPQDYEPAMSAVSTTVATTFTHAHEYDRQ
jgi:hypothetical protein